MRLRDYIDIIFIIFAAVFVASVLIFFTQKYYEEKEQDGRVQDIIIRGKLYNCEEVK